MRVATERRCMQRSPSVLILCHRRGAVAQEQRSCIIPLLRERPVKWRQTPRIRPVYGVRVVAGHSP